MRSSIKLSLALIVALILPSVVSAQEKGPAFWLDWATEEAALIKVDLNDSWDGAYFKSTVHYKIALAELRAKRPEKAKAQLSEIIQIAESVLNDPAERPGDQPFPAWTYGYVHGLGAVIRVPDMPAAPSEVSRPNQLYAAAVEAQAHIATGDRQAFKKAQDRWWRLTSDPNEMRQTIARKEKYLHLGHGSAWEMARLARRADNKELLGILTAPGWTDWAERTVTKAIYAQTTRIDSHPEFSEKVLEGLVIKGFEKAQQHYADQETEPKRRTHHDNGPGDYQFGYHAGLDGCLAETVAAIWVIRGRAEAMTFGRIHGEPKGPWRLPAAMQAALMLRKTDQARESTEALDFALQLRLGKDEVPAPADIHDLARELTVQGRAADVQRRIVKAYKDPVSRSSAAIGIAMGLMDGAP